VNYSEKEGGMRLNEKLIKEENKLMGDNGSITSETRAKEQPG